MIRTQVNNDLHSPLSFIGTLDHCAQQAHCLGEKGVDEIACLIDFGIGMEDVMASLRRLSMLPGTGALAGISKYRSDCARSTTRTISRARRCQSAAVRVQVHFLGLEVPISFSSYSNSPMLVY